MLNEEELRANVPSNVFQQHKEMERVCGRSGKVELLMVAASFIFLALGGKQLECRRCRPADAMTREDFLLLIEDPLADEPDEGIVRNPTSSRDWRLRCAQHS
jgi:hypothetical protein